MERGTAAVIFKKTAHFNTNFSVPDRFLFAFTEAGSVGHFLELVPFPTKRTVDNGPWFLYRFKKFQTFQHDSLLLGLAERFAQRMTIRISQMIGSRRFDRSADFPTDTKTDSGNPPAFDFSLDQTDRLVAEASGRNKEGNIRLHLLNSF